MASYFFEMGSSWFDEKRTNNHS